jgi:site-specific recombinase XerC
MDHNHDPHHSPAQALAPLARALLQFFNWLAAEDEIPDPMAGLRPPRVTHQPVLVFDGDDLGQARASVHGPVVPAAPRCRDAAMIAVFRATRMGLSELTGIRYDPDDLRRSRSKGRITRIVKIGHDNGRALDRYLRVRARHA